MAKQAWKKTETEEKEEIWTLVDADDMDETNRQDEFKCCGVDPANPGQECGARVHLCIRVNKVGKETKYFRISKSDTNVHIPNCNAENTSPSRPKDSTSVEAEVEAAEAETEAAEKPNVKQPSTHGGGIGVSSGTVLDPFAEETRKRKVKRQDITGENFDPDEFHEILSKSDTFRKKENASLGSGRNKNSEEKDLTAPDKPKKHVRDELEEVTKAIKDVRTLHYVLKTQPVDAEFHDKEIKDWIIDERTAPDLLKSQGNNNRRDGVQKERPFLGYRVVEVKHEGMRFVPNSPRLIFHQFSSGLDFVLDCSTEYVAKKIWNNIKGKPKKSKIVIWGEWSPIAAKPATGKNTYDQINANSYVTKDFMESMYFIVDNTI